MELCAAYLAKVSSGRQRVRARAPSSALLVGAAVVAVAVAVVQK